ncbi:MAG: WYL domain-containing protein [Clostridiales bacterium]|nr:WYL domain-containing protein [Clostridiales bacterium]MCF8022317.1 WYL domain-containing protein [Clostridiales bacterium]
MVSCSKKDSSRGLRLNMIIDFINTKTPRGGVTIKELVDKFEVTERQVRRDLDAIQNDMRKPLRKKEKDTYGYKNTMYYFEIGFLPSLSPEKATAIFMSMLQQRGSALGGYLNDLKNALVSTLFSYRYNPEEIAVEKIQKRIHIVEESLTEPERVGKLFTKLVNALKDCCRVKIKYYAAYSGQVSERVVEPYGLICKRQNWYLVGYCLKRQDTRVFRVDQLENVISYTGETFNYPEDFSLQNYMAHSWGVINDGETCKVKLKFSSHVAFRIKKIIYHPSQVIEEELDDRSIIVSFNVCGIDEMKTWIVQWGDAVEVLDPGWLREDMCKWAEQVLNTYRT